MATVHFTGRTYRGFDGPASLTLAAPGHYQVSDLKAAQLVTDFPAEFAPVLEQTPVKAPSRDDTSKKVDTATSAKDTAKKAS